MEDMQKKTRLFGLAVIGGGASGLFAAVQAATAASQNDVPVRITVFEAEQRVGKKLLGTGNGRCNLSNLHLSELFYYGDQALIQSVLSSFTGEQTLSYFFENGLYTRADYAGRVYPACNQATAVLDFLRSKCELLQVQIITQTPVVSLEKLQSGFLINRRFYADAVIYSCGSPAGQMKTDISMKLLHAMQVEIVPFLPALCPLKINRFTRSLKGVRAQGYARLYMDGKLSAEDLGEIQYTEYGISGIPVMQLSCAAAEGLAQKKKVTVTIDSVPDIQADKLFCLLQTVIRQNGQIALQVLLGGFVHKRLGDYFIRASGLRPDQTADSISEADLQQLVDFMKKTEYPVENTLGFSHAQVALGGIPASEVNISTLEFKKIKGLFVCGEALDVAGRCGGYNLQWAWSSGYVAGVHAIEGFRFDQNK